MAVQPIDSLLQGTQRQGGGSAGDISSLMNMFQGGQQQQQPQQASPQDNAELFDASEFFEPEAIRASFNEVKSYQPPQQQQQPRQSIQQTENLFPVQERGGDDDGLMGMIMNLF